MAENNVYTGSTSSVPSDNGGGTPRPAVTPPISKEFSEKVSTTPRVLFTADCAGVTGFQFTINSVSGSVTFSLYINGSPAATQQVSSSTSFTLSGGTGTNVCMLSGANNATVSGKVVQI